MFYSSDASGLRAFIRDKLGFSATDVGDGWLIFDVPEADMGCHPTEEDAGPKSGDADISFYCDDIESTVADPSPAPGGGADILQEILRRPAGHPSTGSGQVLWMTVPAIV